VSSQSPYARQCVLVKGWKSSAGWGFPKGKINEDEDEAFCAVREVSALVSALPCFRLTCHDC
jgi:hypothetical protein